MEISVWAPYRSQIKVLEKSLTKIKSVFADWKVQKYGILIEKYRDPAILGFDIAGDVEEIGEGVTEFQKGDRVWVLNSKQPIVDYVSALNDLLGGMIVPGQFENDYGGFQQYTKAN